MTVRIEASCHITGDSFSPRTFEERTGVELSSKFEVGDIQTVGPYRGKAIEYGKAVIYPQKIQTTEFNNSNYELECLVDVLKPHIKTLWECGAEDVYLDIAVYYISQCNLAFEPQLLKKIADLNIPFWISCYEDYDEEGN